MGFKKIQIFTQNPQVLAYGFTETRLFGAKLSETLYFVVVTPIF
jgi:hypothetical protein